MSAGSGAPDVLVLATGGTVSMGGPRATPTHGADALLAAAGDAPAGIAVETVDVLRLPSAHLGPEDLVTVARAVADAAARARRGVVVLTGTDALEELAVLLDLLHDGPSPVIVTGAIRPASAAGADGPANLRDAVVAAASDEARGLGVLVCFAGELHAARLVTKADSVSPAAFRSPSSGPVGRVVEDGVRRFARPDRRPALPIAPLLADVRIHHVALAERPGAVRATAAGADGLVVAALGAGHLPPGTIAAVEELAEEMPVVATSRCAAPTVMASTYGFRGAEADLRATAIVADPLSPQAARMALMAGLAAGLDREGLRALLAW